MKNYDFKKYLNKISVKSMAVSNWSVGEHIDHICNVTIFIDSNLRASDPKINFEKFSFVKLFVLYFGHIPRGRGKSPTEVIPNQMIEIETLTTKIFHAQKVREGMVDLNSGLWITHPIFGVLKFKNAVKFLYIHTRHHIKIIEDIIRDSK